MRNTTAVVEFPFSFKYPRAGIYEEANSVTVCEPNYEKRAVHRRMSSTVMEALTAWQRKVAEYGQRPNQEAAPSEASDGDASSITGEVVMVILRNGMNTDNFVRLLHGTSSDDLDRMYTLGASASERASGRASSRTSPSGKRTTAAKAPTSTSRQIAASPSPRSRRGVRRFTASSRPSTNSRRAQAARKRSVPPIGIRARFRRARRRSPRRQPRRKSPRRPTSQGAGRRKPRKRLKSSPRSRLSSASKGRAPPPKNRQGGGHAPARRNTGEAPNTLRPHGLRKDMMRSRSAMGMRGRTSRMVLVVTSQSETGPLEHRFLVMGWAAGTIRHMAVRDTWPTARCRVRS